MGQGDDLEIYLLYRICESFCFKRLRHQYLSQQLANKVEDSDPESEGDAEDDAPDAYDYSDPKVLGKRLAQPPVPKQGPTQPPRDAAEATARLACFRSSQETPEALRVLLSARADPNVVAGEGDLAPLWMVMRYAHNHHVREMRDLLIEFGATNGEAELERWEDRLNIDRWETIFMRDFHRPAALLIDLPCIEVTLSDRGPVFLNPSARKNRNGPIDAVPT